MCYLKRIHVSMKNALHVIVARRLSLLTIQGICSLFITVVMAENIMNLLMK